MSAAWLSGYLQGSFREVPFFVNRVQNQGGRRLQSHTFPERDDIYHEDLGRGERVFTLSAYIVGDDYFQHRENLIQALESEGPGKLVHPYRGIFQVAVASFSETESTAEGRIARFDITFKEQKVVELTTEVRNTKSEVRTAKFSLLSSVQEAFENAYDISQVPVSAVQDALAAIDTGLEVVVTAKKVVSSVADFQREISNLEGKKIQLVQDATGLAESFQDIIEFGTDFEGTIFRATESNAAEQVREQVNIARSEEVPVTNTPPEIYNAPDYPAKQIQTLMNRQAIASAVGLVPVVPLSTIDEAQLLRKQLFDVLDGILEDVNTTDGVFAAVKDAKKAVSDELDRRILDLSKVVTWDLVETENSLKLSNEIYGEIEKEQEIIDRNDIGHPMFIPARVPLQVELE